VVVARGNSGGMNITPRTAALVAAIQEASEDPLTVVWRPSFAGNAGRFDVCSRSGDQCLGTGPTAEAVLEAVARRMLEAYVARVSDARATLDEHQEIADALGAVLES
jgi:hypothetical protein